MPEFARVSDASAVQGEIRMIDANTLIGKWVVADLLASLVDPLRHFTEPGPSQVTFYFVLTRA